MLGRSNWFEDGLRKGDGDGGHPDDGEGAPLGKRGRLPAACAKCQPMKWQYLKQPPAVFTRNPHHEAISRGLAEPSTSVLSRSQNGGATSTKPRPAVSTTPVETRRDAPPVSDARPISAREPEQGPAKRCLKRDASADRPDLTTEKPKKQG